MQTVPCVLDSFPGIVRYMTREKITSNYDVGDSDPGKPVCGTCTSPPFDRNIMMRGIDAITPSRSLITDHNSSSRFTETHILEYNSDQDVSFRARSNFWEDIFTSSKNLQAIILRKLIARWGDILSHPDRPSSITHLAIVVSEVHSGIFYTISQNCKALHSLYITYDSPGPHYEPKRVDFYSLAVLELSNPDSLSKIDWHDVHFHRLHCVTVCFSEDNTSSLTRFNTRHSFPVLVLVPSIMKESKLHFLFALPGQLRTIMINPDHWTWNVNTSLLFNPSLPPTIVFLKEVVPPDISKYLSDSGIVFLYVVDQWLHQKCVGCRGEIPDEYYSSIDEYSYMDRLQDQ